MRYLFLPSLIFALSCTPPIQNAREDFLVGFALRENYPDAAKELHQDAIRYAQEVLDDPESEPPERVEASSILSRIALEDSKWQEAEVHLAQGRLEIESSGPDRIWRGDALSIHIMKGDLLRMQGRQQEAAAEYFHAQTPQLRYNLRRHLRIRQTQTLLELRENPKALEAAFKIASEESATQGPFGEQFGELLEEARKRKGSTKK